MLRKIGYRNIIRFVIVPLVLIAGVAVLYRSYQEGQIVKEFEDKGVTTQATITDKRIGELGSKYYKMDTYAITFQFALPDGTLATANAGVGNQTAYENYALGDVITIRYPPSEPGRAILEGQDPAIYQSGSLVSGISLLLGGLFTLLLVELYPTIKSAVENSLPKGDKRR